MDTEDHTRWSRSKTAFTKETVKSGDSSCLVRLKTLKSLDYSPAILFLFEYYRCISVRIVLKYAIIFTWSALLWDKRYGIIYHIVILYIRKARCDTDKKEAWISNKALKILLKRFTKIAQVRGRDRVCHDYMEKYLKLLKPNDVKCTN